MKVIHYNEVQASRYEGSGLEGIWGRVVIGKNDGATHFCMRVLEFFPGAQTLRHSHPWEHEMFIHAGEGEIYGNGQWQVVKSGSVVFIPGNEEHQIRNLCQAPLILICLIPNGAPEI
jgi:quercetin dioxygenase-like cupin family protein